MPHAKYYLINVIEQDAGVDIPYLSVYYGCNPNNTAHMLIASLCKGEARWDSEENCFVDESDDRHRIDNIAIIPRKHFDVLKLYHPTVSECQFSPQFYDLAQLSGVKREVHFLEHIFYFDDGHKDCQHNSLKGYWMRLIGTAQQCHDWMRDHRGQHQFCNYGLRKEFEKKWPLSSKNEVPRWKVVLQTPVRDTDKSSI